MSDSETIDPNYVYALHTFVANVEGQVCVLKGDSLKLLDDTNYYWWLVKCVKTEEIGYIPAENIETPSERLARLNKFRNVQETLANAVDTAEPPATVDPSKPRLVFADSAIVFENYDDIDYDDDEEEEEEAEAVSPVAAGGSSAAASAGAGASAGATASGAKAAATKDVGSWNLSEGGGEEGAKNTKRASLNMKIGTGFLKHSLGFRSDPSVWQNLWTKEKSPTSPSSPQKLAASPSEPKKSINILRIYTGNVDLKATYKAVALTPEMTTATLLDVALKRFRVENESSNNYFLSVLFMDSGEKPLDSNAIVFDALESLKNKNLPGVANFTRFEGKERSAHVMMNDDNIIKVIINKKLNIFEKNYHLLRVYRFERSDPTGATRTYKTIGVNSSALMEEITEIVKDKFKVTRDPQIKHFLCTKLKGENTEIRRHPDEKIMDILATSDGHPIEVEFILREEPASPETARKMKLAAENTPTVTTSHASSDPANGLEAILSGNLPFLDNGGSSRPVSAHGSIAATEECESDRMSAVSRGESEGVEPSYSERASIVDEATPTERSRAQSMHSGNYVLESSEKKVKSDAAKIATGITAAEIATTETANASRLPST
ncbi:hypothetical protein BC830DRAFT_1082052 [Chytriomyces sp. MP71]|nr:hypothetical protein BC830DRAFT_1082052 [Chytriomyces sp. MP71]